MSADPLFLQGAEPRSAEVLDDDVIRTKGSLVPESKGKGNERIRIEVVDA